MESYNNIPKMYQFLVGIKIVEFPKKVIITRSCKSRALSLELQDFSCTSMISKIEKKEHFILNVSKKIKERLLGMVISQWALPVCHKQSSSYTRVHNVY